MAPPNQNGNPWGNISSTLDAITGRLDPKYMADSESQGLSLEKARKEMESIKALQALARAGRLSQRDAYGASIAPSPDDMNEITALLFGVPSAQGVPNSALSFRNAGSIGQVRDKRIDRDFGRSVNPDNTIIYGASNTDNPNYNPARDPSLRGRAPSESPVQSRPVARMNWASRLSAEQEGPLPMAQNADAPTGLEQLFVPRDPVDGVVAKAEVVGGPRPLTSAQDVASRTVSFPKPRTPLPGDTSKVIAEDISGINNLLRVVDELHAAPDAKEFGSNLARSIPGAREWWAQRHPDQTTPLADLGNVKSMALHSRYGGAQTVGELKNADEFLPSKFDNTADSVRKLLALSNALQGHLETLVSVNSAHEVPPEIPEGLTRSRLSIAEHTNSPIGGAANGKKTVAQAKAEAQSQTQGATPKFASEDEAAQYFASKYPSREEAKKAYDDYLKGRK